jgi:flagellar hook assembly protein FlgD
VKLCPRRRSLARAVVVTAVSASAITAVPAAAGAEPAPAGTSASPSAGQAVLIVHVDPAQSVAALARRLHLPVRHRFAALHAVSVRVPAADAGRRAAELRGVAGVSSVERGVRRTFFANPAPDDTFYGSRQASYYGAVDAPAAWARQKGSASVTVAVLDSGVDVTHPDLKDKIVATYNAHDGSADVTDAVGHGTFVAGVAAAETGNHLGVAGAGYNSRIDAVKIADPDGAIDIDDEVAGIRWATAHHVGVINLSLGGPDRSSAEAAAIAAAQKAGVVVVAAAGNESDTEPSYPAAYPGVIAVGATDPGARTRADFSNYGSWVAVGAPGVGIFSTVPRDSEMWGHVGSRYTKGDGTSFSTPLVAGEVALLRAANRGATVSQLRHAVTASAHGYAHLGLGAGQVDFARALRHVPPAAAPSALSTAGSTGAIRLTAQASAPRVAFRVDDEPRRAPVPTSGGVARTTFASWGYANGTHRVRAYACSAYGECGSAAREVTLAVANPAPTITSPAPTATVTGRVLVRAASAIGGPVRLLVDGRRVGFSNAAPYTFPVSTSALRDGAHTLQVQSCSRDHLHCAGPRSAAIAVTARGLHPVITAVTPRHVSPNGDGTHDRATVRFRLRERSVVRARVLDAAGRIARTVDLGPLAAGVHRWAWNGRGAHGARLRDGRYTLVIDTARGRRRGWVSRPVVVDTRRPRLARPTTGGGRLYPSRDGYRDRFSVHTRLGEAGRLTLVVRSSGGHVVRRVSLRHAVGPATISWNGRTAAGRSVPAGRYRWQLRLTDAAGNTTRSRTGHLTVSAARLTPVTRYVTLPAGHYRDAGGTARCATARRSTSAFAGGVHLVNACPTNGFDLAFADYTFTLPGAIRYRGVTFEVRGTSAHRPSELTAAFTRTDGSVEIPDYATIRHPGTAWHRVAAVPANGHVGPRHRLRVSLLLDSFYPGRNDLDAAQVRLRVRVIVLR